MAAIPKGSIATYGAVATAAGNPRGARQVVWALRARAGRDGLPWHRVVGLASSGKRLARISLPEGNGKELQGRLLEEDGVVPDADGFFDLGRYGWDFGTAPSRTVK